MDIARTNNYSDICKELEPFFESQRVLKEADRQSSSEGTQREQESQPEEHSEHQQEKVCVSNERFVS